MHAAPCPTITCPEDIVVKYGCEGQIVTYTEPVGLDLCPALSQEVVFNYTGSLQSWTVPAGVEYIRIEASGAEGGDGKSGEFAGGLGANIAGEFHVTPGDVLKVIVGGAGEDGVAPGEVAGGGGGGSFVYKGSVGGSGLMIVAGGGGGGGEEETTAGCSARTDEYSTTLPTQCGRNLVNEQGQGGPGGSSFGGGGGAGWLSDGTDYDPVEGSGGDRFAGGVGEFSTGGYGGGGGAHDGGGGGGGYTGGPGGNQGPPFREDGSGGGGGGSYNGGINQSNSNDREGDGIVTIYYNVSGAVTTTQTGGIGSGGGFPVGSTIETFEATSSSGSDTCSFNITVQNQSKMYSIVTRDRKSIIFPSNDCNK